MGADAVPGDLLSIDCGAQVADYHGDAAVTVAVGEVDDIAYAIGSLVRAAGYDVPDAARRLDGGHRRRPSHPHRMNEQLALADYRQRVAKIYLAEPVHGESGWRAFRAARDQLFREHPQSALEPADRATLDSLPFFGYDPGYRVRATVTPVADGSETISVDTGGEDGVLVYRRTAQLRTPFGELTLFWLTGYGGGLFLPFRDLTAGTETYGGGRYLVDTIKGTYGRGLQLDGDRAVLDFNYAYNPSCAYNSRYACPLAPRENWLAAPIEAGEKTFPGASVSPGRPRDAGRSASPIGRPDQPG